MPWALFEVFAMCRRAWVLEIIPSFALFRGLYEFAQYAFLAGYGVRTADLYPGPRANPRSCYLSLPTEYTYLVLELGPCEAICQMTILKTLNPAEREGPDLRHAERRLQRHERGHGDHGHRVGCLPPGGLVPGASAAIRSGTLPLHRDSCEAGVMAPCCSSPTLETRVKRCDPNSETLQKQRELLCRAIKLSRA